ncbi:MAG TPA: MmcQ/YjbR family DNA-binding protein [Blastocatellia bacterium]|nr:MmcQ/YjbR family DNA-binding protein [Blastocatellia bacterium]
MNLEKIREYCLSLPHATEEVLWEKDLVFKIGGKMFAVIGLDAGPVSKFSFKCTPEEFAELTERNGIIPAPYAARYHWVAVEKPGSLSQAEVKRLIKDSYEMVKAKLTKKAQSLLGQNESKAKRKS